MVCSERDDPTHVVLRIRTAHANDIASGTKNHEYREYELDKQVKFIWLFEDELQAIRYIMATAAPKRPGEVRDPSGKGNVDFDEGRKASKFGYPVTELYKLPSAITAETLKRDFGMDMGNGRQYVTWRLARAFPVPSLDRVM
ncbi:hypothetical protein LXA43DRAFT_906105 [Ganoderma leucocontextum]|nr:hypothetical protein LXA43DRAFT_906105 [Ganoderma leucocontextum]